MRMALTMIARLQGPLTKSKFSFLNCNLVGFPAGRSHVCFVTQPHNEILTHQRRRNAMKSTGIKVALIALSVMAMTGTTILSAQAEGGEGPGVNGPTGALPEG